MYDSGACCSWYYNIIRLIMASLWKRDCPFAPESKKLSSYAQVSLPQPHLSSVLHCSDAPAPKWSRCQSVCIVNLHIPTILLKFNLSSQGLTGFVNELSWVIGFRLHCVVILRNQIILRNTWCCLRSVRLFWDHVVFFGGGPFLFTNKVPRTCMECKRYIMFVIESPRRYRTST